MKNIADVKRFHIDHKYFIKPMRLDDLTLIQIGERFCGANMRFPEHEQLCFEISYVYNGEAYNTINGTTYRMPPSTFNFTYPSQRHSIYATENNMRYFYLGFSLDQTHPLYGEFQKIVQKNESVYVTDPFHTHSVFLDAILHIDAEDALSRFILTTSVDQILCDFLRAYHGEQRTTDPKYDTADIILFNMLSYLDENFLSFKNLDRLSDKLGYSTSYLSHLFTAAMQHSPTSYVLNKKLQYAAQLLSEKERTVTEISELLGYATLHSFSKAFKKRYGVSPLNYKAEEI